MKLAAGTAQTALASTASRAVAFVFLGLDSGPQRFTTASETIDWDSQTWVGLGNLLTLEPMRETETTEITGGKLTLSGVPASRISEALTENIQGRPITMWFAVMDEALAVLSAPVEFAGRLNRYRFRRSSSLAELEITFESEMAIARRPKVRRFTQEDQQRDYPSDTYFAHLNKTKELVIRFPTAEALRR